MNINNNSRLNLEVISKSRGRVTIDDICYSDVITDEDTLAVLKDNMLVIFNQDDWQSILFNFKEEI